MGEDQERMAAFTIVLRGFSVYEARVFTKHATIGLIALSCLSVLKRPKDCFRSIDGDSNDTLS